MITEKRMKHLKRLALLHTIDITGCRFNRLTAIKFIKKIRSLYGDLISYWMFKCDCGKECLIAKNSVTSEGTKSCGCLMKEMASKANKTHGFRNSLNISKKRFYNTWCNMKTRCLNKNIPLSKNYSGRGINVCDKWLKFENFRDDMYESYLEHIKEFGEKNTSIDRVNNNGNYCRKLSMGDEERTK